MQRLRTVTSLDVSAVAGHHAMPAVLLLIIVIFMFVSFVGTSYKLTLQYCLSNASVVYTVYEN